MKETMVERQHKRQKEKRTTERTDERKTWITNAETKGTNKKDRKTYRKK